MSETLKLGFIGGGSNSAVGVTHFISSQMDRHFSVVAGCFSRHADVNRETAEKWQVAPERTYENYSDLLQQEKGKLDALVILTPTPSHLDIIKQSLEAGYPVISEKALVTTSAEAMEIHELKQRHNGFLVVTYNYTGYPMIRELRNLIKEGMLGRIGQLQIEMPQEGFARLDASGKPVAPQAWRLQDGPVPTISLDLGVHLLHMIEFLTGEKPEAVAGLQSSKGAFHQVVDNVMVVARYSNDVDCSIWYSKSALGHRNGLRIRLYGEKGAIDWFQMNPEQLLFSDAKGQQMLIDRAGSAITIANQSRYNRFKSGHPAGFMEAFANLYVDIAKNLRAYLEQDTQPPMEYVSSSDVATEGLVILEAISEAAASGTWVNVESGLQR